MEIIKLENVNRIYSNNGAPYTALTDINLSISKQELVVVSGKSGSGKTSLLNIIGTLDKPTSGFVSIFGERISIKNKLALSYLRHQKFGFVFQVFNLIPALNSFENIEYPLILAGVNAEDREERVQSVIDELDLNDITSKKPYQLSSGQQQKIAIARAIVNQPEIILADEPSANLETESRYEIYKIFRKLNEEKKICIILATHDELAIPFAKRLIILENGLIKSDKVN
jgi:putative ABC transport system ATP-binding protein